MNQQHQLLGVPTAAINVRLGDERQWVEALSPWWHCQITAVPRISTLCASTRLTAVEAMNSDCSQMFSERQETNLPKELKLRVLGDTVKHNNVNRCQQLQAVTYVSDCQTQKQQRLSDTVWQLWRAWQRLSDTVKHNNVNRCQQLQAVTYVTQAVDASCWRLLRVGLSNAEATTTVWHCLTAVKSLTTTVWHCLTAVDVVATVWQRTNCLRTTSNAYDPELQHQVTAVVTHTNHSQLLFEVVVTSVGQCRTLVLEYFSSSYSNVTAVGPLLIMN